MRQDTVYEVFAIKKGKTEQTARIKNLFIAKDYKNANVYFQGYIWGVNDYYDYTLYKVGKIDKNLKITPCKVFIAGGYETNNITKEENRLTPYQTKILYDSVKEKLQDNVTEALEILFEGKMINE